MRLINIGYGNMISADRVVAIVAPDSAPVKRMIREAAEGGLLIDASCGRKTRSVLVTDSSHVVLSAIGTESVASRISEQSEQAAGGSDEV